MNAYHLSSQLLHSPDDIERIEAIIAVKISPDASLILWRLPIKPDKQNKLETIIDTNKIPVLEDASGAVFMPIAFRQSSIEDWLNHTTRTLIGDIPIRTAIGLGSISISYNTDNKSIQILKATCGDDLYMVHTLADGFHFNVAATYLVSGNTIQMQSTSDPLFTWDLNKLQIKFQELTKPTDDYLKYIDSPQYLFGFYAQDYSGNTSVTWARPAK